MATNKKKLDEKHLKILREMVALSHNKQCLDCHQRGPTYINMTIGAFVCTACSGLLRGLNPPHRVKSISMASFTPEEMDFIKSHGNEFCRKVWLGLYDNRLGNQTESREETKVKDFMVKKYERKQFYVAPTEAMKEEAKKMNESVISKTPGTKPLKSLLGDNTPKLQVNHQEEGPTDDFADLRVQDGPNNGPTSRKGPPSRPIPQMTVPLPGQGQPGNQQKPPSATPPPIHAAPTPQSPGNQSVQSSKSSGSTAMDLLGDLGGDPFASSTPQTQQAGGFADFGNFGKPASSAPPPFAQPTPLQPAGSTNQQSAFNGFNTPASTAAPAPVMGGDKYSNLSDLFSTTTTETDTSSTGWSLGSSSSTGATWGTSSTSTTGSTGINWGGDGNSTGSAGISWGGESNTGSGGINWNSSSTSQSAPSGWGGNMSTQSSWGTSATAANGLGAPGNPFLHTSAAANPFGSNTTTLTSQSTMAAPGGQANPFGGNQMVSQPGGFGAFGGQAPGMPQAGGGFGQPTATTAGFGQFGTQNGGFGQPVVTAAGGFGQPVSSAGGGFGQPHPGAGFGAQGFGAQPAGFGQQPGGFGAPAPGGQPAGFGAQGFAAPAQQQVWGQMPASSGTVNPFMNTAQQYSAPKTGATNPFL